MPLELTLAQADGAVLDRVLRDGGGHVERVLP